jgi:glucokinase
MGGTKTNMGIFSLNRHAACDTVPRKISALHLLNSDFEGPEQLLEAGLAQLKCGPVHIVVLAVAGPVEAGRASLTNLAWTLDAEQLQSHFGWSRLLLINDLEAMAYGLPLVAKDRLKPLNAATPAEKGAIAVIAAGTGLGEAFLTWYGERYIAHAGEGGHADFAPIDPLQIELLMFLMETYGHVSYERICSGTGLWDVYQFFKQRKQMAEPDWLSDLLRDEPHRPRTIVDAAMDPAPACEICRRTIRMFVQVLGAEAGNLALRLLPSGGLFIAGGLAARLSGFFESDEFLAACQDKGRMSAVVANIPLYLVLDAHTPLYGGAYCGVQALRE